VSLSINVLICAFSECQNNKLEYNFFVLKLIIVMANGLLLKRQLHQLSLHLTKVDC